MVIKLVQSVLDKKDMEEARCSICIWNPLTMQFSYIALTSKKDATLTCATQGTTTQTVSTNFANHMTQPQRFRAHSAEWKSSTVVLS